MIVCLGKLLQKNGTPEPELLTRCAKGGITLFGTSRDFTHA